jgi:hypothetical protein
MIRSEEDVTFQYTKTPDWVCSRDEMIQAFLAP